MKKYSGFILLLVNFIASNARAQPETYDLVSFVPPPGWERKLQTSVLTFLKFSDDRKGFCELGIYKSRSGTGDLQSEFVNEWTDLIKKSKNIEVPAERTVEKGTNGWGLISGKALSSSNPPYECILITLVGYGRVTSILFNVSDSKYMTDIGNFLSSMKMVPQPAGSQTTLSANPAPVTGAAGITGIWRSACNDKSGSMGVTNASGTGYALLSSTSGGLRTRHLVCFADGTFCQYIPSSGFINYAVQRSKDPNVWGVYRFGNGEGTVKLDGLSTSYNFTIQNGEMKYDGCTWLHLPWVEDLRLNGTWSWESNPATYKSRGMNAEPTIRFSPDGRFSDTGAVYYLNHVKHESSDMSDNKYGDGRYEIKTYTLSLYFDDGRSYHYTFLNFDGNMANPEQLSVGLAFMTRK